MNSKGFTLVELLAVIVIMALIAVIGSVGISTLSAAINNYMWNSTVSLIEAGAITYGEDNQGIIEQRSTTCVVDEETKSPCITVSLQTLINKGYISTREKDDDDKKVLINPSKDKYDTDAENYNSGYYVDAENEYVYIYIENEVVYAVYVGAL